MSGGSNSQRSQQIAKAIQQYPMANPGPGIQGLSQGAPNPQAQAGPQQVPQAMPPWMNQGQMGAMGQMGGQMMQAGQRPPMQVPQMPMQRPMGAPPGYGQSPTPGAMTMQGVGGGGITPAMLNQMLLNNRGGGLMGR